jgi:hypothetical protein
MAQIALCSPHRLAVHFPEYADRAIHDFLEVKGIIGYGHSIRMIDA